MRAEDEQARDRRTRAIADARPARVAALALAPALARVARQRPGSMPGTAARPSGMPVPSGGRFLGRAHDVQCRAPRSLRPRSLQGRPQGAAYTPAVRRRSALLARLARARRSARSSRRPAAPSPSRPPASSTRPTRRASATARTASSRSRRRRGSCSSWTAGRSACSRAWACAPPSRPADVTVARIRGGAPRPRGGRARHHRRRTSERNDTFIRKLGVPVFVMPGARLEDIERGASRSACSRTTPRPAGRSRSRCGGSARTSPRRLAGVGAASPSTSTRASAPASSAPRCSRACSRLAGARLVGPSDGFTTVNATVLHKLDPDAYVATSTSGVTLARLRSQPEAAHAARGHRRPGLRRRRRRRARGHDRLRAPALARALAASHRHQAVTRFGAVTLDAMGTLVTIEPPAPRLQQLARAPARPRGSISRAARARCGSRCATTARTASPRATPRRWRRCGSSARRCWRTRSRSTSRAPTCCRRSPTPSPSAPIPMPRPALERLAAAGLQARRRRELGRLAARRARALRPRRAVRGRSSRRPRSAPRSPTRGRSRSRSSGSASRPRSACTSATIPPRTWRAREAAGLSALLLDRSGRSGGLAARSRGAARPASERPRDAARRERSRACASPARTC